MEALDHSGVFSGHAVPEGLSTIRGGDVRRVEKIFAAPWNSVQRTAVFTGGNFFVCFVRLSESKVARERDDAAQLGIELLDAFEINAGQPLRGELTLLDPSGELSNRGEGYIGVVVGQRHRIGLAADKAVAVWTDLQAWQHGIPARGGGK